MGRFDKLRGVAGADRYDRGLTPATAGSSSLQRIDNWEDLTNCEPSPELIATVADSLNHLLSNFSDGELRSIVLLKLEGYSNDEVAEKIGRSVPTIERRLRLVRDRWLNEMRR